MDGYPMTARAMENVEPVIEFFQGWENILTSQKPNKEFKKFFQFIENFIGVPINYISTGPERHEGFWR